MRVQGGAQFDDRLVPRSLAKVAFSARRIWVCASLGQRRLRRRSFGGSSFPEMDAEATRAVSAAPSLEVCECCGASDCDGECDTLRPKQQLPLPEVSFLDGKEMSAESLLAAASEAASAAAACGGEARHLSEGEMESCLQKGAEAYLLSVRMEANALPRAVYCREEPSIRKSKRRPSGGKDIMTDSVLCLSGASNLAETTNEAKSSSGAGDSSCRAERNGESGGDRPPPTRKTRYLEQLLRLQTREAEHHPPSPLWAMEALEFFQRIRSWIESQRVKKDSPPPSVSTEDQRASSSVAERCREWKGLDWQIYCRLFPPSLPLLLRCDARSADALLTQLLEDLDTQLKLHAQLLASSNKAKRCASRRLPADAGEAEAEGKAEREQDRQSKGADADESERTAKAAAQDGSTSALSLSSHKCCSVEGMPTSLPQLSWFFAALAVLDPVEVSQLP